MKRNRQQQLGVALISVMLVVALAAILAGQMTARIQLQMQRSINISFNEQAYWYAMGAEALAKRVLASDLKKNKNTTHLEQDWAQGENTYPVDYGQITGEIVDLQACFNLNALRGKVPGAPGGRSTRKPIRRIALEELIIGLNLPNVSQFEAESMVDALVDWLDEDSAIASVGGAEDNDYASLAFPYLPANYYLASITELRAVANFTPAVIKALKPYVCVLPNTDLHNVNINTLNSEQALLLQALLGITLSEAQEIISKRPADGFASTADFSALPEVSQAKVTSDHKKPFVVKSHYFKLKTKASFNDSYFSLSSIIYIEDNQPISVVSRKIGRN